MVEMKSALSAHAKTIHSSPFRQVHNFWQISDSGAAHAVRGPIRLPPPSATATRPPEALNSELRLFQTPTISHSSDQLPYCGGGAASLTQRTEGQFVKPALGHSSNDATGFDWGERVQGERWMERRWLPIISAWRIGLKLAPIFNAGKEGGVERKKGDGALTYTNR